MNATRLLSVLTVTGILVVLAGCAAENTQTAGSLRVGSGPIQLKFVEPEGARIAFGGLGGYGSHEVEIVPAGAQHIPPFVSRKDLPANSRTQIKLYNLPGEGDFTIYGEIRMRNAIVDFTDKGPVPIRFTAQDVMNVKNNLVVKKVVFIVDPVKRMMYEEAVGHTYWDDLATYPSGMSTFTPEAGSVAYAAGIGGKDPVEIAEKVGAVIAEIILGDRPPTAGNAMHVKFLEPEGARIAFRTGWGRRTTETVEVVPASKQHLPPYVNRCNMAPNSRVEIEIYDIPGDPEFTVYGELRMGPMILDYTDKGPIPIRFTQQDLINVKNDLVVKKVVFLVDPDKRAAYEEAAGHTYFEQFATYESGMGAFSGGPLAYVTGVGTEDPEAIANQVGTVLVVAVIGGRSPSDVTSVR